MRISKNGPISDLWVFLEVISSNPLLFQKWEGKKKGQKDVPKSYSWLMTKQSRTTVTILMKVFIELVIKRDFD